LLSFPSPENNTHNDERGESGKGYNLYGIFYRPEASQQCHDKQMKTVFTPLNKAGLHHMKERVSSAPLMGVPEVD